MHYCEYLRPSKFPEKEVKSVYIYTHTHVCVHTYTCIYIICRFRNGQHKTASLFVDQQLGRPVAAYTY